MQPWTTPATDALPPGLRDPRNLWAAPRLSYFGLAYNTKLVPAAKAPRDWMDLCDPFFKGNVSFDPAEARYLAGLHSIMGLEGTEKFLKCIGANDPIVQRGHLTVSSMRRRTS